VSTYTPWEDVTPEGSPIRRRMRLNTEGRHSIETHDTQNCDEILAENRESLNLNRENFGGSLWNGRGWVKVASIPMILIEKWAAEDDINFMRWNEEDKAKVMRRLNDNEYSKLRTAPGRI
jgi:hypothetical protein